MGFLLCGVMMGGSVSGVLFLVFLRCVRGFVFIVSGAVGFVVVVISGSHWLTLLGACPPSELVEVSTLCCWVVILWGLVMAASIFFIIVLRFCWFNFWTDSVHSAKNSRVCWIGVNSGSRQCCGKSLNDPDMRYDTVSRMKKMQFW